MAAKKALAITLCLVGCGVCVLQSQEPQFSVVSIRPSTDNLPGMAFRPMPNGGYSGHKVTVLALLTSAFEVSPRRVVGAPLWPDRYDIEARYEPGDPASPAPRLALLLQSMLRDRFGLVAHFDKRELPVYALTLARKDGMLGSQLRRARVNCADANAIALAQAKKTLAANGAPACGANEGPGVLIVGGLSMETIARALRVPAGRDVVDQTGLTGLWEAKLEFALPDDRTSDKPSFFSAVQEQLGLKLESSKAPLDVLVVDTITRPTPN
jgi:uncharacterized protein (TIGR03435 family)